VFALLQMRGLSYLWAGTVAINVLIVSISRGALLSIMIPFCLAMFAGGHFRRFAAALPVAALMLIIAYAIGLELPIGNRSVGPQQLFDNLTSIIGSSDASNLDGTKAWRLRWWQTIQDYTFNGPFYWTGKGFVSGWVRTMVLFPLVKGMVPILRSPHNAHLTMLARAGIPGLCLWLATGLLWFGTMVRSFSLARARGSFGMG